MPSQPRDRATGPGKTVDKGNGGLDAVVESPEACELLTALARLIEFDVKERHRLDKLREEHEAAAAKAAEEAAAAAAKQPKKPEKDVFRKREDFINECDLSPNSLVGSWCHKMENAQIKWQGCVVAEPQAGVYLLELHNWIDGASAHQRVVTLKQIAEQEDGYEYRFYDSDEWMRIAGNGSSAFEADRQYA